MSVVVGSTNPVKVEATRVFFAAQSHLSMLSVLSIDVGSGVSPQPKSLEETIKGAEWRAVEAYHRHGARTRQTPTVAVGLESGVFRAPALPSRRPQETGAPPEEPITLDVCACVIVRPDERHPLRFRRAIGLSSAWEVPSEVAHAMYYRGRDMDQAFVDAGYTTDPRIGAGQGAVGLLSGGQLDRQRYTEQALLAAAIGAGLIPNDTWKG